MNYSHHDKSYGCYNNLGQHASGQGIINNIHQYNPSNPLEELEKHCSHTAAFDSAARFDPPRCVESTRLRIIQIIEEWVHSDADTASLFWLHGGAGAGKSALAQSLSEKFHEKKQLGASFFFFRSEPTRNNGELLILTLVSHLVRNFKRIVPFVENRIRENPALFTKRYETQLQELLIQPLLALNSTGAPVTNPRPQLIVIDGLDECEHTDVQCELLRVIARAIPQIPYPLRFLVTSRPEAHITRVFNHDPGLQAITVREYNLSDDPDADRDIHKFLEKEFKEIRRVHSVGRHLPHAWPDRKAITSLVERSSGHFIYASTVIRYIRSPKHRPDNRLEVILRLRPPREGDQPYGQLDALYTFIFQGVENHGQLEKICLVLGILYFQSKRVAFFSKLVLGYTAGAIEGLLEMEAGDLVLLLDPILSLLAIDGDKVRILHKSLFDYLLDFTRGGNLPFDLAQVHGVAATYILKQGIVKSVCTVKDFECFAYHCQYAYLNDSLKDYLRSLEVPYPESLTTPLKRLSSDDLNSFLQSIIWFFFRTLSRKDFDSTGRVCGQWAAKWMGYLHPAVPGRAPHRFRTAAAKFDNWLKRKLDKSVTELKPQMFITVSETDGLKRQLDKLFIEWKPQNFNPMDVVGMDPVRRVDFIKQVHGVLSASAKASFSGDTNAIVSSLVLGDYFIHGYHFKIQEGHSRSFLILQTYSRHGNTSYGCMYVGTIDIVQETVRYLSTVGKYLFSDFCQKYGLNQDEDTFIQYIKPRLAGFSS